MDRLKFDGLKRLLLGQPEGMYMFGSAGLQPPVFQSQVLTWKLPVSVECIGLCMKSSTDRYDGKSCLV